MFNVINTTTGLTALTTDDLYYALGFIKFGYLVKGTSFKATEALAGVHESWGLDKTENTVTDLSA